MREDESIITFTELTREDQLHVLAQQEEVCRKLALSVDEAVAQIGVSITSKDFADKVQEYNTEETRLQEYKDQLFSEE